MRRLFSLVAALLCSLAVLPAAELRQNINANREWKFQLGDVANADVATFDDSSWSAANLPHSFSMPYFAADRFYVGYGWYRKHFEAPAAWSGKRVSLEFDGVFQVAEVFVNGRRIGEHKGGYTGFSFDITDAVKTGDNVVSVRVNFGEGPTRVADGRSSEYVVFGEKDFRFVRSKDSQTLYITGLKWPADGRQALVTQLGTGSFDLKTLKKMSLLGYGSVKHEQRYDGLSIELQAKNPNVADYPYVLKLEFAGKIPDLQDRQTKTEPKRLLKMKTNL